MHTDVSTVIHPYPYPHIRTNTYTHRFTHARTYTTPTRTYTPAHINPRRYTQTHCTSKVKRSCEACKCSMSVSTCAKAVWPVGHSEDGVRMGRVDATWGGGAVHLACTRRRSGGAGGQPPLRPPSHSHTGTRSPTVRDPAPHHLAASPLTRLHPAPRSGHGRADACPCLSLSLSLSLCGRRRTKQHPSLAVAVGGGDLCGRPQQPA
jgi:hypothetical protein